MTSGSIEGYTDALPELMTKRQVADFLQCSQRQVEILTQKRRICQPVYIGESSPRWRRSALLTSLDNASQASEEGVK